MGQSPTSVMDMVKRERAELADLLESLTPEQWSAPSLCAEWSVHQVAAHVISYEEHGGGRELVQRLWDARLRPWRLNDVALRPYEVLTPGEVVAFLRTHLEPQGATARFGGRVGLTDGIIHQQDIRRPLGLPRDIPAERLRPALGFAVWAPPLRGFWKARRVRLVATDLDWSYGQGPEARGPAEAVLMAMAGRAGVAGELTGPGADVLVGRFG